jgi:CRISPR-associated protein Csb2
VFALGLRYIAGFVAASELDNRERPEWPPHPARVFMALAAAYFETGGDAEERRALEWLETLPPPMLRAPEAMPRRPVTHYVPVNDKPSGRTGVIQSIPHPQWTTSRGRAAMARARAWRASRMRPCWR